MALQPAHISMSRPHECMLMQYDTHACSSTPCHANDHCVWPSLLHPHDLHSLP